MKSILNSFILIFFTVHTFGAEIILQNPNRVKGMIVFFFSVTVTQILLVLKKKQFEKVQAAEMNF